MIQFLVTTLNGLTLAGLFFLVASGLTLIFGLMRVINLAHGGFYLFAAYFSWKIISVVHNWVIGAVICSIGVAAFGTIFYFFILKRFQYEELRVALITLGLSLVLEQLMLAIFGGDAYKITVPKMISSTIAIPGSILGYPIFRIVFLVVSLITGALLWVLITKTKFGSIIRAGVDDTKMVSALGINVQQIFTIVFAIGCAMVGFAGTVGGTSIAYGMGTDGDFLLFSLQVVIVGGLGSITGAAIGSLLIGLVNQFASGYVPTFSGFLTFAIMILVLAFRPQGLMGNRL